MASSSRAAPEVVVYIDPSKRKKTCQNANRVKAVTQPAAQSNQQSAQKIVTMKRARFEVHKFGISGFTKEKKEEAKVKLAVKLGAKPPKNKFYNYKEYQEIKKSEKEEQAQMTKIRNALGFRMQKSQPRPSKKQLDARKGLQFQVGKYKNGVQHVPKRLIKAMNRK